MAKVPEKRKDELLRQYDMATKQLAAQANIGDKTIKVMLSMKLNKMLATALEWAIEQRFNSSSISELAVLNDHAQDVLRKDSELMSSVLAGSGSGSSDEDPQA